MITRRTRILLLPIFSLVIAGRLCAQADDSANVLSTELTGKDLRFLSSATDSNLILANLGELLKSRAETGEARLLGGGIAKVHITGRQELHQLAATKGVQLSTTPTAQQIAAVDTLSKLTGPTLEKACLEEMLHLQQKEIVEFEAAMKSGDADLKAFAEKYLPQFKEQLVLAEKITSVTERSTKRLPFRTTPPQREKP